MVSKSSSATRATTSGATSQDDALKIATALEKVSLIDIQHSGLVDTCAALSTLVDSLSNLPKNPPSIYVDLEGVNLSRHGTVSILQLFVLPAEKTYLVDIFTLKEAAFVTPGSNGQTLKTILESEVIPKAFFDVRNDSDALFSHFGINLGGICDIQLMELATRKASKRLVNGLSRCIEKSAMTPRERQAWIATKEMGVKLFDPKRGGNFEVFNVRPMPETIRQYCTQDVQFLPKLWTQYSRQLTPKWAVAVDNAVRERIKESQGPAYNGKGRHMALGPWKA